MYYAISKRPNYSIDTPSIGPSPEFFHLSAHFSLIGSPYSYEELLAKEIGEITPPRLELCDNAEPFLDGTGERGVFKFADFILDCSSMTARRLSEACFYSEIFADWEILRPIVGGRFVRFTQSRQISEPLAAAWTYRDDSYPLVPAEKLQCPIFYELTMPNPPRNLHAECEKYLRSYA